MQTEFLLTYILHRKERLESSIDAARSIRLDTVALVGGLFGITAVLSRILPDPIIQVASWILFAAFLASLGYYSLIAFARYYAGEIVRRYDGLIKEHLFVSMDPNNLLKRFREIDAAENESPWVLLAQGRMLRLLLNGKT